MGFAGEAERPEMAGRGRWRGTLFAVAVGALWLIVARDEWGSAGALLWIDVALGVASVAAMQFRRRRPLAVTVLTVAATAVSASAIGAWVVCQVSLSARRRWPEVLPTAVLSVATGQILYAVQPDQALPWYVNLIFTALATGVVVAVGMYVGARRELVTSLRDRAERAEREQRLRVAAAQAGERARIAREMHDVLAHRMSLVALHAGALVYRTDLSAAETQGTAGIIQANSQAALADLREILGLLRDTERGEDPTGHRPQPTLGDLDTLLDEERAAGAHITVHSDLEDRDALPVSTGRSAYRILEEGLTNARKHAPHAAVTVELTGRPGDGVDLIVQNPVRVDDNHHGNDATGFGLVGLAERAAASHGHCQHGVMADGDFVLRAWLPWDR
ncbi:sensor histidine kinase [Geodermatophilus obscurus]|uniref:histidine kinase n=1 Tax=Geodermatophilus obscurus (strain ATCC 25078 / DSM 43160 / JCM 3152 / CCUG 61914 / KCC A-0152 / KCTC 9177 / NBRC 13315 / NRRL B-3577 / G-20) TaxID=526225 RepID=D2SEZ0_GEOOG|nr:histidine kinase [Geodermatophilus obscurus]ADB74680.1 histidine kinase dimerization and phosphoacceptor region [Geodermatophilus obscurus DSM 43160]